MVWVSAGVLVLSDQWAFTAPLTGDLIRVTHWCPGGYGRGLISQAATVPETDLFNVQRLFFRQEREVFTINRPVAFAEQVIAARCFYPLSVGDWLLFIEFWDGT